VVADKNTLEKIADLAAISIEENDMEVYVRELDMIIKYMEELKSIDTGEEQPMEHILAVNNIFREDDVNNKNIRDELIKNASVTEDGYFKVPAVVDSL
jgi:aspartyl-tRNA(Asn)/glutamyl-tRNA(Gln) amidotransferase subunit C